MAAERSSGRAAGIKRHMFHIRQSATNGTAADPRRRRIRLLL